MAPIEQLVTVRAPFSHLVIKGHKPFENRRKRLSERFLNKPTVLTQSGTFYSKSERHKYYKKYEDDLNKDSETERKVDEDLNAWCIRLDKYFVKYKGKVLGLVTFCKSYKSKDAPQRYKKNKYYNYPKAEKNIWIISDVQEITIDVEMKGCCHVNSLKSRHKHQVNAINLYLKNKPKAASIEKQHRKKQRTKKQKSRMKRVNLLEILIMMKF